MFKFIHAADIHLDSPLWGLERYEGAPVEEIRGSTRRALENLVRLAIEEHVDFVLLVGDLYDGDWKDYNTALFLSKEVSKLHEVGIQVFIVTGNHDAASQITRSLRMPDNVKIFSIRKPETVLLERIGVAIHGQGFRQRVVMEDLSTGYPAAMPGYVNIGMLHTAATGREGHDPYAPCTIEGLLSKKYDYWALGHVHKREIIHEAPWIIFPGNTQGRHIRETGPKGCSLVKVDDDKCITVDHRDLHVLQWIRCEVDATDADTPEEVVEKTRSLIMGHIDKGDGRFIAVRVIITGTCKAHDELSMQSEKWINEIRSVVTDASGRMVWIENVEVKTRTQIDLEELLKREDSFSDLLKFIKSIESSDDLFKSIKDDFTALRAKLPSELFVGSDAYNLESPENVQEILEEVKQLLIPKLFSAGGNR